MGFPEHQAAVDHRRHQAVGVERAVGRIVETAEASAAVDALERQAGLVEQPEHFLDVGGIGSAVHHDHRCAPIAGLYARTAATPQAVIQIGNAPCRASVCQYG